MKIHRTAALTAALVFSLLLTAALIGRRSPAPTAQSPAPETAAPATAALPAVDAAVAADPRQLAEAYGRLPLAFEPNLGQTDARVEFLARGHGYSLFLTGTEAVLALEKRGKNKNENRSTAVRMSLEGANRKPAAAGLEETAARTHYFLGNRPEEWRTEIPNYGRVKFAGVYEGVDLVYYGSNQRLEYDFVVAPEADPQRIRLKFEGLDAARVEEKTGDLLLETAAGTVRQHAPVVYQTIDGERRHVAAAYALTENRKPKTEDRPSFEISFRLGRYDRTKELVIDPILVYGSYLGGNAFDEGRAVAVDAEGNAYVVGTAASRDFPTTAGTLKPALSASTSGAQFWYDAFVAKINPAGTALVYSTYFGGRNGNETGSGVEVDAAGNVLLTGTTMASDLPTVNAYQTTFGGTDDAFAAKLNASGSALIYSTYLGGNNTDLGGRVALNRATGDAVFAGSSSSPNFPTTPGAYKQRLCTTPASCSGIFYSGSYLVKLSATGSAVYATLFDAGVNDLVIDAADNAVVGGTAGAAFPTTPGAFQPVSSGGIEGLIAKMNPSGTALVFGTFLGGGLQSDRVRGIALDAAGNIYVTGQTQNAAFPTSANAFDRTYNGGEDGFVTKLNASGSALVYSTFLGGNGKDEPAALALGAGGEVFVAGETLSNLTFPLKNSLNGTSGTIFLARLNPDASALVFSTLLGQGGAYDVAVDAGDNVYLTGHTTTIPVTPNAFQTVRGGADVTNTAKDAFVMKLGPTDETVQTYSISGTVADQNWGYNNNYTPIVVTVTGAVSRSISLPYSGNGTSPFFFGNLPAGGNYTVTVRKTGFAADPESVSFTNLGANQFAEFTLLRNREPEAQITSPPHGSTYTAPATIPIEATASDPDGDPIARVEFLAYGENGFVPLGSDDSAPYQYTWTDAAPGNWSIYAIPVDSKGLRGTSQPVVQVIVLDPTGANISWTSPTEGQSFSEGSWVPLAVSVSSSVTLVEVRDQNNNLVARMFGSPWSVQWRAMTVGNYTLTATATTTTGQTAASAPLNISITPINHRLSGRVIDSVTNAPVGGLRLDLTSPTNPSITAQTVTDSAGNYLFTDLGTTPNDGVVIRPVAADYAFSPETRGASYLGYIDWPNLNFIATRQTAISVELTAPTDGQTYVAPATINLAAAASSGAGTITQVEFLRRNLNGSTVVLGTDATAPYEFQLTGIGVGGYTYLARATDSNNFSAQSADRSVTVNAPTVNLSGRVFDFAGAGLPGVEVYVGGGYAWSVTTDAEGRFAFADLPGGRDYYITPQPVNTIRFTPTQRSYTNVTADVTGIEFVGSPPNQAPSPQIASPANGAVFTMPEPIPLQVNANDPDNNVTSLRVTADNGSQITTVAQTSGASINTLWSPLLPGTYTLTATVRDAGPLPVSTQVTITVNPPAPVSIAGRIVDRASVGIDGVTVELKDYPARESVVATAVTDADGRYAFPNVETFRSYVIETTKLNYTFAPRERIVLNLRASQTGADYTGTLQVQPSEFDGDGRTDAAVWRPSTGVWYVARSSDQTYTALQFGGASFGDEAVPGNYDGDKKTDYAVFRSGVWYVWQSSNNQVRTLAFGTSGDIPVPGDFDGDGKTDLAVWRPSSGVWYIWRSSDGGYDFRTFGLAGDRPLAGDYDGDGLADITIWRPSTGVWYVQQSSDLGYRSYQFGADGDRPLVGDFDGDKKADYAVFRPSSGVWYVNLSANGGFKIQAWGLAGDTPVPGDYDRDGKTDLAVFRKTEGNWYVFKSSTNTYTVETFGVSGDVPIPAAYSR